MAAKIFRINYKSDFILTLNSDAGWMTPFCIKFWTGAPSQAFFVGWDGETYTHCAYDPSEPTKLLVQFDDHRLPIGDLKFQIAYHFTVADFPNDTEDEVINPANITTEIDGETYQVMLDFRGETAPEIEFSLPAYANEAQRIENEQQRIANEQTRIENEQTRISNEQTRVAQEQTRQQNEAQRIAQESSRVSEFASLKSASEAATRDANNAATLANEKAQLADDKAALADSAATQASLNAVYAHDEGQLAGQKAMEAAQATQLAANEAAFAHDQGNYAKNQGDYAKAQGDTALADHVRANADHSTAVDDHTQANNDHTRAESDHSTSAADHTTAGNDHTLAESDHGIAADDHTQAGNDHTRAESDHGIASDDHTQAGNDHTRAESDHTRAESDHAAVEVYVDSLGAFDISAYHATGGVLAEYADLTAALGTNGANVPESMRKGGMSVKFVSSIDNKYVQYRLMADSWSIDPNDWAIADGGVYVENPEFVYVKTDAENKILWAIKTDGSIYYGAGVPQQVIEYIEEKIADLSLDEYEDIVAFLDGLEEGDKTLQTLLDEKVDKEEDKSLIDEEYADGVHYIENSEFVDVKLDDSGRILWGIQKDGNVYFGAGVPPQVIKYVDNKIAEYSPDGYDDIVAFLDDIWAGDKTLQQLLNEKLDAEGLDASALSTVENIQNPEYIEVTTDGKNQILEGIKTDGTKVIGIPVEIQGVRQEIIDNSEFMQVTLDSEGKIIEGINGSEEKHITSFDRETKSKINDFVLDDKIISIKDLNTDFVSSIPYKVYNGDIVDYTVKGTSEAKYVFELERIKTNFNIRVKFRITENIYNNLKSCKIVEFGNSTIKAKPIKLHQLTEGITYNDVVKTMYWPCLEGGVSFGESLSLSPSAYSAALNKSNIGLFAFSIQYTGNSHDVTIENNGEALIIKVDGAATTFDFTEYQTVEDLYSAIKEMSDISVLNSELEGRRCDELAIFDECKLVSLAYTGTDGKMPTTIEEYWDAAPFFIPYAVDETWHQVEIVGINNKVYIVCDGITSETNSLSKELILGGECGVLFKELEISLNSTRDAELVESGIISCVNPFVLLLEGHGVVSIPSCEVLNPSNSMAVTTDRLQHVFSYLKSKGYIPVTIKDVADYYDGNISLPKRCYVPIFDDTTSLPNCLDIFRRGVISKFGVKPAIAIISGVTESVTTPIMYNGQVITIQQAADICASYDFYLVSHTKTHRNCAAIKPSEYINKLIEDFYEGDLKRINGSILIYPYGKTNAYNTDCMKWLGFRIGVLSEASSRGTSSYNYMCRRKYTLGRIDLALKNPLNNLLEQII